MRKALDYERLILAGLPVPIHRVYDERCVGDAEIRRDLAELIERIRREGSGLIGVRTEPKDRVSALGNYPHFMPLRSAGGVIRAMRMTLKSGPGSWWFLVNEAFVSYVMNGVVMLQDRERTPGLGGLDGEVNTVDNVPLRPAMSATQHLVPARRWYGGRAGELREMISRSGMVDTWVEVSLVRSRGRERWVFWGIR